MAFRVLSVLAATFAIAAVVLFLLGGFAFVIALAVAAVFALGALVARGMKPSGVPLWGRTGGPDDVTT